MADLLQAKPPTSQSVPVSVEQLKTIEQTMVTLADALKGLKSIGDRMETVERQMADAQRINAEKASFQTFPIFGGQEKVGEDLIFKEITTATPPDIAKGIIGKVIGSPTDSGLIKEWQEWCDTIKIMCGVLKLQPRDLNLYKRYESWCEKSGLGKVISVVGSPANWIPDGWSGEILTYYQQKLMVATLFEMFPMPTDPFRWDFVGTGVTMYLRDEPTADPASKYRASDHSQSVITFSTREIAGRVIVTRKLTEDAIAAYLPRLRTNIIPRAMAEALERALLNGDTQATHMDTAVTALDDVRKAWNGLRRVGHRESATYNVQSGSSVYAFSDFSQVMLVQGKYGVLPQEGAWVMSNPAYIQALAFDEVETADKINIPTNINGVINIILGRPVIVSPEYPITMNSSGIDTGSGSLSGFLHVNRPQFMIGVRREDDIEQDRDISTGQETIVITTRKDFQQMLPTGEKTVGVGINVPTS